jgi:serine/threonine-protein kinase
MSSGDRQTSGVDAEEGASDSRRDPLIGAVVNGKYRVESAIARGGMGRIYYANQVPLERPVALKVVQGDGDQEHESQFLKRFLQEASILAKLQHPNVVTLFDYGKIEGSHVEQYFIAMEFLAGETLMHRFKNVGRMSAQEVLVLGRQIVRGLREAHKHGVVHRDLKPSNIILVPEGDGSEIVKLVDFGIGKVLGRSGDNQDLTQDGVFVGTPRYMAPEQFEGHAYPASDLYALGTILFQALAGRLPFVGSSMSELMIAKLARPTPTVREVTPDAQLPDSLEGLVMHLLARRPEDRPDMDQLHAHFMLCEEEVFGSSHSMRRGNSSGPHSFGSGASAAYSMRQTGSGPRLPSGSTSIPQLSLSGSGPNMAHGMPPSMPGQLRVPPTVVAQIPSYVAQLTPRPIEASTLPSMHEQKPSRAPLLLVGLALLLLLGGGAYWARSRTPGTTATTAGTGVGTAAGGAGGGTGASAADAAFTLTIDSAPPGATVSEGENVLGETPLKVAIDRASVAQLPRTFVITKEGFAPSRLTQGPSYESVRSMVSLAPAVALAPDASSAVKSRPPGGGKPVAVATGTPPARPTATAAAPDRPAPGPGTDIRLKR